MMWFLLFSTLQNRIPRDVTPGDDEDEDDDRRLVINHPAVTPDESVSPASGMTTSNSPTSSSLSHPSSGVPSPRGHNGHLPLTGATTGQQDTGKHYLFEKVPFYTVKQAFFGRFSAKIQLRVWQKFIISQNFSAVFIKLLTFLQEFMKTLHLRSRFHQNLSWFEWFFCANGS